MRILLAGGENFRVNITQLHHKQADYALISMNDRDPRYMDYYKLNISTGERVLVYKNEVGYSSILFDSQFRPRVASMECPDASSDFLFLNSSTNDVVSQLKIPFEDTLATGCWCFGPNDKTIIMADSRRRDTAALVAIDTETHQRKILAEHPKADASGIELHPYTHEISAVTFNHTIQ